MTIRYLFHAFVIFNIGLIGLSCASCSSDDDTLPSVPFQEADMRLEPLLDNLQNPWGLVFPSSEEILFTERPGNIWLYNLTTKTKTAVTGGPNVVAQGQGGLLDVVLHPNFEQNRKIYFSYSGGQFSASNTALGVGELIDNKIENFQELFIGSPLSGSSVHFGSRLAFDDQGFLYMSIGDRGQQNWAQDSSNHAGKLLRFNDDGSVPNDNPYVGVPGAMPEIYTMGNRNIQGMDLHPTERIIYTHEHGPQGGDELNKMIKGANYGWPLVTHGINYNGTPITPDTTKEGFEDPIYHWTPSVAPCGMAFVPAGVPTRDNILIGTLAAQHLKGVQMSGGKVTKTRRYFEGAGRFRAVAFMPNNRCFVLTEAPGMLYELVYE